VDTLNWEVIIIMDEEFFFLKWGQKLCPIY
jgi:hypothetical protein